MTCIGNHIRVVTISAGSVIVASITRSQSDGCFSIPRVVQVGHSGWVEFTAVDTFYREINTARQLRVNSQRTLPCCVHLQILVDDGRSRRSCCVLTTCRNRELLQLVSTVYMEIRLTVCCFVGLIIIIGVLTTTGITHCRYEPYKWQTTYEVTCTTTEHELLVAKNIPIETYTRGNGNLFFWQLVCIVAIILAIVGSVLQSTESCIVVVLQLRIDRQLETQTCGEAETVREIDLVLNVSRELVVFHLSQELVAAIHREGDTVCSWLSTCHEIFWRRIYIVTCRSGTESIGSLVGLILYTSDEILDTYCPCCFIGSHEGLYLTEVTLCEWVWTQAHVVCTILQNIHCWEHTSQIGTRLILIRVCQAKGVVPSTPFRVPFTCYRGKVLFLIVTGTLEVKT